MHDVYGGVHTLSGSSFKIFDCSFDLLKKTTIAEETYFRNNAVEIRCISSETWRNAFEMLNGNHI